MVELHQCHIEGDLVLFSEVEKESEKGLFMNRRLLLMVKNKFICYLSSPEAPIPFTLHQLEKSTKTIVPLSSISRLHYQQGNRLQIEYWVNNEEKPTLKKWLLKMKTPTLLGAWQEVFDEYTNRSRAGTLVTEDSKNHPNFQGNINESLAKLASSSPPKKPYQLPQLQNPHPLPPPSISTTLHKEVSHSKELLGQDPNESYFATLRALSSSPPPSRSPKQYPPLNQKYLNCFRPHFDFLAKLESSVLKADQLKDIDNKYSSFIGAAEEMVVQFVDSKMEGIVRDAEIRGHNRDHPIYEEKDGMLLEAHLLDLTKVANNAYICDRTPIDQLRTHFKNLQFLQEAIGRSSLLRQTFFVPMACLVTYKGFLCLVSSKISPEILPDYYISTHNHPSGQLFDHLSEVTHIDFSVLEDQSRIEFLPLNSYKNRFAIVHARSFLPQLQQGQAIHPEVLQTLLEYRAGGAVGKRNGEESKVISQIVNGKIRQLSDLMNKLEVYPVTPAELEPLLQTFGLDSNHLGVLYSRVSHPFLQALLKTAAAVEAFTIVFPKKMQDSLAQRGLKGLESAALELLNAFLGKGEDWSQLWKVVSLHSQKYFGLSLTPQEINKGYLVLGLSAKLAVDLHPTTSNINNVFQTNSFLEGVNFNVKSVCPWLLPSFMRPFLSPDLPSQPQLFTQVVSTFQLQDRAVPALIARQPHVHGQVLLLIALYCSPKENKFKQLGLYSSEEDLKKMNGAELQRGLAEIRWEIKEGSSRDHVLLLLDKLGQKVKGFFGETHPFLSEIHELQGLYHVSLGQEEQAIEANKQALRNMVACCGHNQNHLRLSNTHYNIAQCLAQYGRLPQALSHLRKAKQILEGNRYEKEVPFAHLLLRMAGLILHQQKDSQALQYLQQAAFIYQKDPCRYWQNLVESYQMMTRCQVKSNPFSGLKLAEQVAFNLQLVLERESTTKEDICSEEQLVRALKVILEQYLLKVAKQDKGLFRNYLLDVCDSLSQALELDHRREACTFFRNKVKDGSLLRELQGWVSAAGQMSSRWRQEGGNRGLRPRTQAVAAFDLFMRQVVGLVGQSFLLNTL